MDLGTVGVWLPYGFGTDGVSEIEQLGYGALWLGGSPALHDVRPFLAATQTLPVATGILNIWQHDPADVARQDAELRREFPGRFLLGVGVGHPEATSDYARPLSAMRTFVAGLEAGGVAKGDMCLAALGPKMLDLAGERTRGTHPYFITPDHTRFARERLGDGALVAPEVAVVVDPDPDSARATARRYAKLYLGLRNYTSNLLRFGFTEDDLADGGSDRLIDAVIPHGTPEQVAAAVREHLDAGADHVCVQPLGGRSVPVEDLRALAAVLL